MKDAPSHMMKFIRKITKKAMEEAEDDSFKKSYKKEVISKKNRQKVKKRKIKIKQMRREHIPQDLSPEEQNRLMKERTPRFRNRSHKCEIHVSKK